MKEKGFTIIELLVVVAIIAVLSSVVIVAFDVYRARSSNSNIQATLGQVRSEAALYREAENGSYDGLCDETGQYRINEQYVEARLQSGGGVHACHDDEDSWVMAVQLRQGSQAEYAWCVDSTNYGGPISLQQFSLLSDSVLCQ